MKNLMAGASLLALLAAAGSLRAEAAAAAAAAAPAAPAAADSASSDVEEVVVTGTRETGIKAADSPAPIQLVGHSELLRTGNPDLAGALTAAVPSLNIETQAGDSAGVQVLAALRGLSPNDTLVLVNGKRRHTTSNLAVDSGNPYSGSATTDLSFIPVDAIDHIEVLTDGAAAQYGTDAIAGVINIILKSNASGGLLDVSGGQYYNGQGDTASVSFNHGFNLADKGFINVTLQESYHDFSVLGVGDRRVTDSSGNLLPGLTFPTSNAGMASNFPHLNQLNGDPQYNLYNALINSSYSITDNVEFYTFDTFGYMESQHYENYRVPTKVVGVTSGGETVYPFPNGFDPREKFDEIDYSMTAGFRGTIEGWRWDLSTTYGGNRTDIYVVNSANAQLYPILQALSATPIVPQTDFYNGQFQATQWTNNLDIDRRIPVGLAAPLNVGFGVEYRRETYGISPGEPSSYFGAGAQSFDGYTPLDQGEFSRSNVGVYVDFATDPIKNLHVDLAGRFEHYSDFGSTEIGKATWRYDFTPQFAMRSTISSGFRAPTLAEEHYSGTNVTPTSADVQLPPNSSAAGVAGFGPLKPELSHNYSVGWVFHPIDRLQITADLYHIILRDRILATGFIYGTCCTSPGASVISQGVLNAIEARGVTLDSGLSYTGISLFTNSANTVTNGAEVTANYSSDFGEYGHVDWSLGFNWNKTHITQLDELPTEVQNVPFGQVAEQSAAAASALTTGTPRTKTILQAYWTKEKWSVNLRGTLWGNTGQYTATSTPVFLSTPTVFLVDLDIGYKFTKWLKLDIGANNLLNTKPPSVPIVDARPVDGALVYSVPISSAWNPNGGYYYGRVTVSF
ncbi:MAG TPA: TonB-dependent receptor [Caulobacteraceae bacterium]|nr:TonB-dependent receptor [Caulobacteraceae bacterium]